MSATNGLAPAFDPETGEVLECANCAHLQDVITGLQRDVRGWTVRFAELARDKDREAREHASWPEAAELFDLWKRLCRHPRSRFTADRFWQIAPHLTDPKFGKPMCERAIRGAAFDCFVSSRRNGSTKRHDDFELIFRDRGKAEEFACRAPKVTAA